MNAPEVRVGGLYLLAEDSYRWGRGPLLLKVTKVGPVSIIDGQPWIRLSGRPQFVVAGEPQQGREVSVKVLVSALPTTPQNDDGPGR